MKLLNSVRVKFPYPLQTQSMNTPATTKVRRRLFADTPPLNTNNIKSDVTRVLEDDYERFKAKYNYDFDANKPLKGPWEWLSVESDAAPSFYIQPYPAKTAESLRNHHMACLKDRDHHIRNNNNNNPFYRNGHFQPLSIIDVPGLTSAGDAQITTTTITTNTNSVHPVLPATPYKGPNPSQRSSSSSCGTKRKIANEDGSNASDVKVIEDVNEDNNLLCPDTSLSPLHSSLSSSSAQLPSPSPQDSVVVGDNLPNNEPYTSTTTTTTDKQLLTSQTTPQTSLLLAQHGKYLRQTNLTEYMKSQKNASEPVAKQARTT